MFAFGAKTSCPCHSKKDDARDCVSNCGCGQWRDGGDRVADRQIRRTPQQVDACEGEHQLHLVATFRHMRPLYEGRSSVLNNSLSKGAPHVRLSGLAAGFHAVAHLPRGTDETTVVSRAYAKCIVLF